MAHIGQIPGGGRAFGDIFTANTPALDRFGNQLYQDQKIREAQRAKQQQMLDEEFARNISKIKDADIPEAIQKYGDFKLKTQMLMRKKGGGTPEEQFDVLKSKGAFYDTVNKSKAQREDDIYLAKDMRQNWEKYDDDNAHNYLIERIQTPTSKLGLSSKYKDEKGNPVDLINNKSFFYKGTNYNLGDALKKAAGTPHNTPYQKEEDLAGGLGKSVTNYQFGNNPLAYKEQLMGQLATAKGGRSAAALWTGIPQAQKELVDQMYNDTPLDKWEMVTGKRQIQPLIVNNPDNAAEQLANYQAKLNFVSNEPVPMKTQQLYDRNSIMNKQEQNRREDATTRFNRAKVLVGLNKGAGSGEADFDVVGKYLPNAYQIDIGTKTPMSVINAKDIDPHDLKTITAGKVYPKSINGKDVFEVTNDGDLIGEDGQKISRESVARERSKETSNVLYKRGLPKIAPNSSVVTPIPVKSKWDKYKR